MSTPDPTPPAAAAPAPAKKSNTVVIVVCVVLGIVVLLIGSCVATCFYVGKKAKDYAKESQKHPQVAALAMAANFTPGVEVVSKDLDAGTIVLRNKKTGETVKLDANNFSQDKIAEVLDRIAKGKGVPVTTSAGTGAPRPETPAPSEAPAAPAESSSSAGPAISSAQASAMGSNLKKFPADFPVYTSGGVQTLEANQQSMAGMSSSTHEFLTSDTPEQVAEYYTKKMTAAGYVMRASENGSDEHGPTSTGLFQKDGVVVSFTFTARIEGKKTHVDAGYVSMKQ